MKQKLKEYRIKQLFYKIGYNQTESKIKLTDYILYIREYPAMLPDLRMRHIKSKKDLFVVELKGDFSGYRHIYDYDIKTVDEILYVFGYNSLKECVKNISHVRCKKYISCNLYL